MTKTLQIKQAENKEKFKQICMHAYEHDLVDEYTHTALKSIALGFKVEMIVGKRYSPNGLRVLAEVKEIYPHLLTIHADCAKTFDTTVQIGNNFMFGNKGDPYTFDIATGFENCSEEFLSHFEKHFNQEKNDCIELKTKEDFKQIFDYSINKIGYDKTKNCHIHFSKIEFTQKGEVKHLNLDDTLYGPEFEPLAYVIDEYKLSPTIISESKDRMMEDAIKLKEIYDYCRKNS